MAKSSKGPAPRYGNGPARAAPKGNVPRPSGPRTNPNAGLRKPPTGGGEGSLKHVKPPIVTGKPQTRVVSPDAASNIGRSVGTHVMNVVDDGSGRGSQETRRPNQPLVAATPRDFVPMGNAVALNVGRGGPGAGRILHGQCGSQGQWGPANPGAAPMTPTPGGGPGGMGFPGKGDR